MDYLPSQLIDFLNRTEPVFIHLAVSRNNDAPFSCRGYGYRLIPEEDFMCIYILKSQYSRIKKHSELQNQIAVLLTSGDNNESYQLKGPYREHRALTEEDKHILKQQIKFASQYFPNITPVINVNESDCLAIIFSISSIYSQTPGPNAGFIITEGGEQNDIF